MKESMCWSETTRAMMDGSFFERDNVKRVLNGFVSVVEQLKNWHFPYYVDLVTERIFDLEVLARRYDDYHFSSLVRVVNSSLKDYFSDYGDSERAKRVIELFIKDSLREIFSDGSDILSKDEIKFIKSFDRADGVNIYVSGAINFYHIYVTSGCKNEEAKQKSAYYMARYMDHKNNRSDKDCLRLKKLIILFQRWSDSNNGRRDWQFI